MKLKTSELIGHALDWAVAKIQGAHRSYLVPENCTDYRARMGAPRYIITSMKRSKT